jgi:hypothetical protein
MLINFLEQAVEHAKNLLMQENPFIRAEFASVRVVLLRLIEALEEQKVVKQFYMIPREYESTTKMDPTVMTELHIYTMLFLIGFGSRLYNGQAYTHVHETENYTSKITSEYMQMSMKGKHYTKFDYGGTGYFFLSKKTLPFKQWDPGGCSCSWESYIYSLRPYI